MKNKFGFPQFGSNRSDKTMLTMRPQFVVDGQRRRVASMETLLQLTGSLCYYRCSFGYETAIRSIGNHFLHEIVMVMLDLQKLLTRRRTHRILIWSNVVRAYRATTKKETQLKFVPCSFPELYRTRWEDKREFTSIQNGIVEASTIIWSQTLKDLVFAEERQRR